MKREPNGKEKAQTSIKANNNTENLLFCTLQLLSYIIYANMFTLRNVFIIKSFADQTQLSLTV